MRRRPAFVTPALCALALLSAWPALAQYKWKDAQGQVHVSDLPPPRDVPDRDILRRPGPAGRNLTVAAASPSAAGSAASAAAGAVSRPSLQDPELAARRKRADQEAQARQQAEDAQLARQRADNCQRARAQLAGLQSGQRMARLNERGERVAMDDAMRQAEVAATQAVIASDCR